MRILIIEDEKELAKTLKTGLENFGFICDISNTALDGEEKSMINEYDCILLDLNLPDNDGLKVLKELRENNILTPIIITTARGEVNQRAQGLDLGADDYVSKPYDLIELRARIQAVTRRFYKRATPNINIGKLNIDPKKRVVTYDLQEIKLSSKEFDILEYIGNKHPEVVSSEDICEHVYDEFFNPFSSVLRVHMSNLRKKIKMVSKKDILITLKGKGYRLWEED